MTSAKVVYKSGGSTGTIYPSDVEIDLMLDIEAIPTASFRIDPSFPSPDLGDTVAIYLEKESSGKTVFVGEVMDLKDILEGKTYRWKEITAQRWGKCLIDRNTRYIGRTLATSIMTSILQPLVDEGLLSSLDIASSSETIKVDFSKGVKIRDALRSICSGESNDSPLDWDFYVDNNKVFHAFPRGQDTNTFNLYTNALEYEYEKSIENIINKQKVLGGLYNTLVTDVDWTEDTLNWTVSDVLKKVADGISEGGVYVIWNLRPPNTGTSPLWMKRSTNLSIKENGIFSFYVFYECAATELPRPTEELKFTMNIKLKTDDSNYFEIERDFGSTKQGLWIVSLYDSNGNWSQYISGWVQSLGWKKIQIPIGRKFEGNPWSIIGDPNWENITEVEFNVLSPTPKQELLRIEQARMQLDNIVIITRVSGEYEDTISQNLYGLKEGEGLVNNYLRTSNECIEVAKKIVNAYKDPVETIKNLTTAYNFESSIGVQYNFDDGSINTTQIVRRIHHVLKDFSLTTDLDTSSRWIPSPERILKRYASKLKTIDWKTGRDSPPMYIGSEVITMDIALETNYTPPSKISSYGNVLSYHLDEGSGTIAYDASKYLNDGTIYNGTYVDGKFGKAISLDGSSSYIEVPHDPSINFSTVSFSVALWVKAPNTATYGGLLAKQSSTIGWAFYRDGATLDTAKYVRCRLKDGVNTAVDTFNDYTLFDDTWHHVVIVVDRDNDKLKVYVDGMKDSSELDISSIGDIGTTVSLTIGKEDTYLDGEIDEVKIYNKALSSEEVYNLYIYGAFQDYPYREDIRHIRDYEIDPPIFSVVAKEIDTPSNFYTWIEATIYPETNAGGYVLAYKNATLDEYQNIYVEQPTTGNAVVRTPDLPADTSFDVKVASISQKGQVSIWSSEVGIKTKTNDSPPPAPATLGANGILNGVYVEWKEVTASDFSHYILYADTVSPPANSILTTSRAQVVWRKDPDESYTVRYFGVKAVDTAGNVSDMSPIESAAPGYIKPIDLQVESRPWSSNLVIWWDSTTPTYNKLYWAGPDSVSDATITFADGSTDRINANTSGTTFSDGIWYFYAVLSPSLNNLYYTQDYSEAVGEIKGLLAIAQINNADSVPPTILQFNSYIPTIGAGAIAAKAIRAEHLITDQAVITNGLQIDSGIITSDHILNLNADKVIITSSTDKLSDKLSFGQKTAIMVEVYGRESNTTWTKLATFVTEQLGVDDFNSAIWTNYYNLFRYYSSLSNVTGYYFRFGQSYLSRIENFQVSPTPRYFRGDTQTTNDKSGYILGGTAGGTDRIVLIFSKTGDVYATAEIGVRIYVLYAGSRTEEITSGSPICVASGTDTGDISASGTCPKGIKRIEPEIGITVITGDHIDTGSIKAKHIDVGAVTTEKIKFDALTSDPASPNQTLWYIKSPTDQLRFASDTGEIGYIPRYPITTNSSKNENIVLNSAFEEDIDGDGIPDFWNQSTISGSPSFNINTNFTKKGGTAISITCDYLDEGAWSSNYLLVRGDEKYYSEVQVYNATTPQGSIYLALYWYDKSKTFLSSSTVQLKSAPDTSWTSLSGTVISPSDARYSKVYLGYKNTDLNTRTMIFDDVIFSEVRTRTKSVETVEITKSFSESRSTISPGTWVTVFNFSSIYTESDFIEIYWAVWNPTYLGRWNFRVKVGDKTSDEVYWRPQAVGNSAIIRIIEPWNFAENISLIELQISHESASDEAISHGFYNYRRFKPHYHAG
jgi:hypothetical protein